MIVWRGFFSRVSTASHSNFPVDLNNLNMVWMNRRKQKKEWCWRDLSWKIARKKLLLSFQYDFYKPYQLPKPKRHSYSQGDKGFIVIGFNLSLTTWKDKSKLKYNNPCLLFLLPHCMSLFSMHVAGFSDTATLTKICSNCSTFLVSFACNKRQPWSDPDFWDLGTMDLTTRRFSTFTSMVFFP